MKLKMMLGSIVLAGSSLMAINAQAAVATTPEQAVQNYFDAIQHGDETAFYDAVQLPDVFSQLPAEKVKETKHEMFEGIHSGLQKEGGIKELDVAKAKPGQDANHVTVHVKAATAKGEAHEMDAPVIKVANGWKIGQ